MPNRNNAINSVDWISILLYVSLIFLGWISIYGASYDFDQTGGALDFTQRYGKQLIWIACALFFAICLLLIDSQIYYFFAYFIYILCILLLLATVFLATEIKGSRSWLVFGPISLQPAEFAKFATSLALAKYMSNYNFRLGRLKDSINVGLIIFIPFAIILLQNETGSALVYVALMFVLYREGMHGIFLFLAFWAVLLFILVIRYMGTPVIGDEGSLGKLMAYIAIIIVQIILVLIYEKNDKISRKIIGGNIFLFLLIYLINLSDKFSINYETIAFISIIISVFYLLFVSFKYRKRSYLLLLQ